MNIIQVVAVTRNNVIGKDNDIPWRIPGEQQRFKANLRKAYYNVAKTFEFIAKPLPNRRNIVVTKNPNYEVEGAEVAHSLEEAISLCDGEEKIVIGGGETLYRESFELCNKVYRIDVDTELYGRL